MATRPNRTTYPPEWCTSGTATDPGPGQRATGWLPLMALPAAAANFLWKCLGIWVDYFDDDIQDGRLATTGYKYPSAAPMTQLIDLSPPGTYQVIAGTITYDATLTPPQFYPGAPAGIYATAAIPIRIPENLADPGATFTITKIACLAKGGATSSARLRLMSVLRDGASAFATEVTFDFTSDFPAGFGERAETAAGLPFVLAPDSSYYLFVDMYDTVTAANVAVSSVWIEWEKSRVE